MRIEWWWARSREAGWDEGDSSGVMNDAPYFTVVGGRGMVGVPATALEVPARYQVSGGGVILGTFVSFRGFASGLPSVGFVGLVMLTISAGLAARVHALSHAEPSFWVDVEGVISGEVTVPWTSIRRVERTSISAPSRLRLTLRSQGQAVNDAWDLLALEIVEFDGVRGLKPVVAGLANLQARRRVVLAAAEELYDPETTAAALDFLVQHPDRRTVLGTAQAEKLFSTGSLS